MNYWRRRLRQNNNNAKGYCAYKLDTARYARRSEIFGKNLGLLAPLDGTSDEHKVGASMFGNIQYLFEMHIMKRFEDPTLIAILQKMRKLHGAKLTEATELDTTKLE